MIIAVLREDEKASEGRQMQPKQQRQGHSSLVSVAVHFAYHVTNNKMFVSPDNIEWEEYGPLQ